MPWSGSVAQQIEPNTSWLFNSILPSAGSARIEKRAFDVASYGRQLGLITEVLVGLAGQAGALQPLTAAALDKLNAIKAQIDQIKIAESHSNADQIERPLRDLKGRNAAEFAGLAARLRPLIGEAPG